MMKKEAINLKLIEPEDNTLRMGAQQLEQL